jgi:hypothetical protein
MRILITSLSGHRIDELLADYAYEAMKDSKEHDFYRDILPSDKQTEMMWVFNGINDSNRSRALIEKARSIPTYYFWDDHSLPTFEHMITVSQFEGLGDKHFQISELAVFDSKWNEEINFSNKIYDFVYWGHKKPERREMYDKYIVDEHNSLLIGEWDGEKAFNAEYERDMRRLNGLIKQGKYTIVFGDEVHNGRSIPLRVYEAAMNGLIVLFDENLVKGQKFTIDSKYIINDKPKSNLSLSYEDFKKSLLKGSLREARKRVTNKLKEVTCLV